MNPIMSPSSQPSSAPFYALPSPSPVPSSPPPYLSRAYSASTSTIELPESTIHPPHAPPSLSSHARFAFSLHHRSPSHHPATLTVDDTSGGLQVTTQPPPPSLTPPPPPPPPPPFSQQPNPFTTTNFLSILFLHLLNPLLVLGRSRPLTLDDLWQAVPADRTEVVHARLEVEWEREVKDAVVRRRQSPSSAAAPSLFRALRRGFGWRMYVMLALEIAYYCFYGTIPFTMRALVTYIYAADSECSYFSLDCSWVYSFGLGLAVLCSSICINHKVNTHHTHNTHLSPLRHLCPLTRMSLSVLLCSSTTPTASARRCAPR